MEKFSHKGVIVAIACLAVAFCLGGSIFGLIAPEPHSYAKAALLHGAQQDRVLILPIALRINTRLRKSIGVTVFGQRSVLTRSRRSMRECWWRRSRTR